MKIKNIIVILLLAFLFSGCLTTPERRQQAPQQNNNPYTQGNVTMHLVRGSTTQDEVTQVFGAPNIVTQHGDGTQSWIYQKNNISIESTQKGANVTMFMGGVGSVLLGGGAGSAHREKQTYDQSSRTMTLIIKFDKNGVVQDFRSMSTSF